MDEDRKAMEELKDAIYRTDSEMKKFKRYFFENNRIHEENKELIGKFINSCTAEGLSKHRIMALYQLFRVIGERADVILNQQTTKEDIERLMVAIMNHNYSPRTVESLKGGLKKYYRWLHNIDSGDKLPDCVRWMKNENPPSEIKKEMLLTEEEIGRLVTSTNNIMHKAMVSVAYEGVVFQIILRKPQVKGAPFSPFF